MPAYRGKVKDSGMLLAGQVFNRDKYSERMGVEYWIKFTFPYHWKDILSTIDMLTLLGFNSHPKIGEIIRWFETHMKDNGI
jgi:hypothetical protein